MSKQMNLEQAVKRLHYTVSNKHKCNDTDADAFNAVVEWINRQKEERLSYNHHFAKLAMFVYNEFLVHYKGDNMTCEKEIMRILEVPLEHHYEKFKSIMDMYSLNNFFEGIGTKPDFFGMGLTLAEMIENTKDNKELFKKPETQGLFKEHLEFGMYSMEEIHGKLNHFLTELLNRYEHKDHDLHWMLKYTNKNEPTKD